MTSAIHKIFIVLTAIVFLSGWTGVPGAHAGNPRIAVLISHDTKPYTETLAGIQQYLRGQGIQAEFDVYHLKGDKSKAAQVIQKVNNTDIDVIYTLGKLATEAALDTIVHKPVIACLVLRTEKLSKAHNATGVGLQFSVETQFQWLKRFLPQAHRIGVIYNPEENQKKIDVAQRVAHTMGLALEPYPVHTPRELPLALKRIAKECDVFWGVPDGIVLTSQTAKQVLLHSFRNRIPFVGLSSAWVKAGALYALEWDYTDIGKQSGEIAVKILRGDDVSSIALSSPRTIKYSLNRRTVEHMKVHISEEIIRRAHKVY